MASRFDKCIVSLKAALEESGYSEKEAKNLVEKRDFFVRVNERDGMPHVEAVQAASKQLLEKMEHAALIDKRNKVINYRKKVEIYTWVRDNFAERPDLGLIAKISGDMGRVQGISASTSSQIMIMEHQALSNLQKDLRGTKVGDTSEDLWTYLNKRTENHLNIYKAIYDLGAARDKTPGVKASDALSDIAPEIRDIAEIVVRHVELARLQANAKGANVGKITSFVIRQTHRVSRMDPLVKKGVAKFGFDPKVSREVWKDFLWNRQNVDESLLDFELSIGTKDPVEIEAFLNDTYDALVSGNHNKAKESGGVYGGGIDYAKNLSQERVLHFRNGESEYNYMMRFGAGDLVSGLLTGLSSISKKTAIMDHWGTNPEQTLNWVVKKLQKDHGTSDAGKRLRGLDDIKGGALSAIRVRNNFEEMVGATQVPANGATAQIGQFVRTWQNIRLLGSATVSAIVGDPFLVTSELVTQGFGFFDSWATFLGAIPKRLTRKEETKEMLSMLGVFTESYAGRLLSRYSTSDAIPGFTSKVNAGFFKWTGLAPWTNAQKEAVALAVSHRMALNKAKGFDELSPDMKGTLKAFDIDADKWEIIRNSSSKMADDREYVVPEAIFDVDSASVLAIVNKRRLGKGLRKLKPGQEAKAVKDFQDEVQLNLRSYISESMRLAVNEPGNRTRAALRFGTQRGTVWGEFMLAAMQFKSFPTALIQGPLKKRYKATHAADVADKSFMDRWNAGKGGAQGVARLAAQLTLSGYVIMGVQDLLNGKSLRDPRKGGVFIDAFVRGGAAGVFGDIALGVDPKYSDIFSQSLGPTIGSLAQGFKLVSATLRGDEPGAAFVRFGMDHMPLKSVWAFKGAFQYIFLHEIMNNLNPGYLSRMQNRMAKERGQAFLMPHSEGSLWPPEDFVEGVSERFGDFLEGLSEIELRDILGPGTSETLGVE